MFATEKEAVTPNPTTHKNRTRSIFLLLKISVPNSKISPCCFWTCFCFYLPYRCRWFPILLSDIGPFTLTPPPPLFFFFFFWCTFVSYLLFGIPFSLRKQSLLLFFKFRFNFAELPGVFSTCFTCFCEFCLPGSLNLIFRGVGMSLGWQSVGPARRWRRFDSPVRQGTFLPESTLSADSLSVSVQHLCTR